MTSALVLHTYVCPAIAATLHFDLLQLIQLYEFICKLLLTNSSAANKERAIRNTLEIEQEYCMLDAVRVRWEVSPVR